MYKAISIITAVKNGIASGNERFVVPDDEHVIDTITGVTYHIYDHWYKLAYDGKTVATMDDFSPEVLEVIVEIKELISAPGVLNEKREKLKPLWEARMQQFSDLYENPMPTNSALTVKELGTEDYIG